ncbi:LAQU0S06e02058g1_1 [Lachancea quebecensis]|uniref:2,5-diamino-6-ribosylamino-4(3H)-pyrimidinone 5'-phosphate reductase n=1 Tax=Lachancea quebecensis TaxID=1654605 RepID=A0A0N7MLL4_9SACH|nr:LAQU0S06e02058g1_1 [Lachancea quebecensis]
MSLVPLKDDLPSFLDQYLPTTAVRNAPQKPFVTLTYAQSLDSRISKGKGLRTTISHPETKTMTHYLRYQHDAIMIGCGTALADDPGLNCKWAPADNPLRTSSSPRPVIIDPQGKWDFEGSKMQQLFREGAGKPPVIVVRDLSSILRRHPDATYVSASANSAGQFDWLRLMLHLKSEFGFESIMIEGGALVINQLLSRPDVVDSLIVTVGAKYLGLEGVEVSPPSGEVNLCNVKWWRGTVDAVMGAELESPQLPWQ